MKTYEEFKIMSLRPAFYNGTQFEADVNFDEASAFRVSMAETEAVNMVQGDTVRIGGRICNENNGEYISVLMCGDELTEFIEKYGVHEVSATVRMKLELVYAVYSCNDYSFEPSEEEIIAYKLIEIIGEKQG